jgi:hypothetical protein
MQSSGEDTANLLRELFVGKRSLEVPIGGSDKLTHGQEAARFPFK